MLLLCYKRCNNIWLYNTQGSLLSPKYKNIARQSAVFRFIGTFTYFLALFWYILQIACALFTFRWMHFLVPKKRKRVLLLNVSYQLLSDIYTQIWKEGKSHFTSYIINAYGTSLISSFDQLIFLVSFSVILTRSIWIIIIFFKKSLLSKTTHWPGIVHMFIAYILF